MYSLIEDTLYLVLKEILWVSKETVKLCLNRHVTHLPSYMPCVFLSMYSTLKSIFQFSYFDPDLRGCTEQHYEVHPSTSRLLRSRVTVCSQRVAILVSLKWNISFMNFHTFQFSDLHCTTRVHHQQVCVQ